VIFLMDFLEPEQICGKGAPVEAAFESSHSLASVFTRYIRVFFYCERR